MTTKYAALAAGHQSPLTEHDQVFKSTYIYILTYHIAHNSRVVIYISIYLVKYLSILLVVNLGSPSTFTPFLKY